MVLRTTIRWTAGSSPGPVVGGDQIRTTAAEQQSGEPLDRALAGEEPDVTLDTDDEAGRSQVSGGRTGTLSVSADVLRQQPLSSIRFQPASGCWACSNTIRVRSTRERMPSLLNMRRR